MESGGESGLVVRSGAAGESDTCSGAGDLAGGGEGLLGRGCEAECEQAPELELVNNSAGEQRRSRDMGR